MSVNEVEIAAAKRGKVVADGRSSLFGQKLNEASIFSFNFDNAQSSSVEGKVCVLDSNDKPTGEYIRMVPRSFPSWFVFGCENGTIVTYTVKTLGNGTKQANVKVGKKPRN